jgi:hypothetical protein
VQVRVEAPLDQEGPRGPWVTRPRLRALHVPGSGRPHSSTQLSAAPLKYCQARPLAASQRQATQHTAQRSATELLSSQASRHQPAAGYTAAHSAAPLLYCQARPLATTRWQATQQHTAQCHWRWQKPAKAVNMYSFDIAAMSSIDGQRDGTIKQKQGGSGENSD